MTALIVLVLMATTSAFAGDTMVFRKSVVFNHVKHQTEWVRPSAPPLAAADCKLL